MSKTDLPRCIAHVPSRREPTIDPRTNERKQVQGHQCHYRAHAAPLVGVLVCLVHGKMRRRVRARPVSHDQLALKLDTAGSLTWVTGGAVVNDGSSGAVVSWMAR